MDEAASKSLRERFSCTCADQLIVVNPGESEMRDGSRILRHVLGSFQTPCSSR